MNCSNLDKSMNVTLLEEVFHEVESQENSICEKQDDCKSGFLEDLLSCDINLLGTKKKERNKTLSDSCKSIDSKETESSLIHEGLTDSSDDEDNKYFEENNYSEYGKAIKTLIKQNKSSRNIFKEENFNIKVTPTSSQPTKEVFETRVDKLNNLEKLKCQSIASTSNFLVDPILGMRIINPFMSSSTLKIKMTGRIPVGTSKINHFISSQASKDSDWVTGGAVVGKFVKTSQKGNQYCIWNITDLTGDIKTVSVLLFGSAYSEFWKTSLGTVVGILNPVILDNTKGKFEAVLRIDNAQKILLIGKSKDYGICKSKKKNGENCSSIINTAKCDFCIYHMKKEYKKACRRSELQPPKIGRSLDNLRSKVLGKNSILDRRKAFIAKPFQANSHQSEKDKEKLRMLSQKPPLVSTQANKNKEILKKLNGDSPVNNTSLNSGGVIDLNFKISKKDRNKAKEDALKYVQQYGPLKKIVENQKIKKTPEQISSLKRRLEIEDLENTKKLKIDDSKEKLSEKEKLRKHGITDAFLKLMNSQPQNSDLLKIAENEESDKYFSKLEVKEKIEDKMASTFKVECKAVRCLRCNYKSFSASEMCKKEKHPLKIINAVKRFWKCSECYARTVCLELIPLHSCKLCGSVKWVRSSMMPEKKEKLPFEECLSIRGHEEKFIGSNVKNANLNLLVPEESS